jgi:hypothetical protein
MEPESMVRALEIIRDLLNLNGVLIDLRPKGIPAEFWGHKGETTELLGHILETDDFIEYRHAAWAMEQVLDKKLFQQQASGEYKFIIYADSFDELNDYLTVEWTDAVIHPNVKSKALEMGAEKVSLRDFIRISIMTRW